VNGLAIVSLHEVLSIDLYSGKFNKKDLDISKEHERNRRKSPRRNEILKALETHAEELHENRGG